MTCTRKTGDCPECGKRCSFIADTYTRTIRDLDLCPKMNLTDAADVAKINWKTAKRIDKKYLSRLVTGLDAICPTELGVDEIAYRKGHNYLTVVRDLDIGRVIWIGRTRKNTALDAFFKELGAPECSWIQVFVMDTWEHELRKRNFPTIIDKIRFKFPGVQRAVSA